MELVIRADAFEKFRALFETASRIYSDDEWSYCVDQKEITAWRGNTARVAASLAKLTIRVFDPTEEAFDELFAEAKDMDAEISIQRVSPAYVVEFFGRHGGMEGRGEIHDSGDTAIFGTHKLGYVVVNIHADTCSISISPHQDPRPNPVPN